MKDLNYDLILKIYAIVTLTLTPVTVIALVILQKSIRAVEWLDSKIDKLLNVKQEKKTDNKQEVKEEPKTAAPAKENKEDEPEDNITRLRLAAGDEYHCCLSQREQIRRTYDVEWIPDNYFIGNIDKDSGLFKAVKTGKVKILTIRKGDDMDPGNAVYEITVNPKDKDWFADIIMWGIITPDKSTNYLSMAEGYEIVNESPAKRTIKYAGHKGIVSLTIQADKKNMPVRALWRIKRDSAEARSIEEALNERMEEIKTRGDIKIWTYDHKTNPDYPGQVIAYAYKKESVTGDVILGIGKAWRDSGDKQEFLMNVRMAEALFSDCSENEPLTKVTAIYPKRKEPRKIITNTQNEEKDTVPDNESSGISETNIVDPTEEPVKDSESYEKENREESTNGIDPEDMPDMDSNEEYDNVEEGYEEEGAEEVDMVTEGGMTLEDFKDYD